MEPLFNLSGTILTSNETERVGGLKKQKGEGMERNDHGNLINTSVVLIALYTKTL